MHVFVYMWSYEVLAIHVPNQIRRAFDQQILSRWHTQSPWPVFTQTCNSGFGRLELLPAKKKNLRFNYISRVVTLHHCQYHKNPTKSVHYGLTIVYSNLHIASLDLFVYLEILKNKFVNHNMENNALLIPFSFTIWK